jgi:hypothetical protein
LADISLGSLQRIQLEVIFFDFLLDVGGEVTRSLGPLHSRLAVSLAIGTCFICHHTITLFAGLHDGITSPTVVGTAVLLHKDTFCSHLNSLTNHGDQPPF